MTVSPLIGGRIILRRRPPSAGDHLQVEALPVIVVVSPTRIPVDHLHALRADAPVQPLDRAVCAAPTQSGGPSAEFL